MSNDVSPVKYSDSGALPTELTRLTVLPITTIAYILLSKNHKEEFQISTSNDVYYAKQFCLYKLSCVKRHSCAFSNMSCTNPDTVRTSQATQPFSTNHP